MAIPVFRPSLRRRDMDAVLTCMVSDRIGPGALAQELASSVSTLLAAAGGVALSSYMEAILCALDLLGIGEADAVIVSPLAPVEYEEALRRRRAIALRADVDPATGVISARAVNELLSGTPEKRPRAVIIHHTLGHLPDAAGFQNLGVPVIEDISQSLGGYAPDRPPALVGDLILLSLDPPSLFTAGSGGLLLGRLRKDWKALRELCEGNAGYTRLADLNAALGLSQLREVGRFVSLRREIGTLFLQSVCRTAHRPLVPKEDGGFNFYSFPVLLEHGLKEVRQYAQKKEVETRLAYAGSILAKEGEMDAEERVGAEGDAVERAPAAGTPEAKNLLLRCLLFPLYPALSRRNIEAISRVLMTLP